MKKIVFVLGMSLAFLVAACGDQTNRGKDDALGSGDASGTGRDDCQAEKEVIAERLREFDTLDFKHYNNQNWEAFSKSHADNIKVYYPDGSTTEGLNPEHIDMLKPLFVFAPDTKIDQHPIAFGTGEWTAVVGEMHGTFSKPMPLGNGKSIPPTGKKFRLRMCTIGKWDGNKMTEEHLFWDNQALMKQIGLAK